MIMGMNQPIGKLQKPSFPPEIIAHVSGSTIGFRSACATLRTCFWNAASLFPMRQSAGGVENMVQTMPVAFAVSDRPAVMAGTSMRLRYASTVSDAGCGGLSIKMATC